MFVQIAVLSLRLEQGFESFVRKNRSCRAAGLKNQSPANHLSLNLPPNTRSTLSASIWILQYSGNFIEMTAKSRDAWKARNEESG